MPKLSVAPGSTSVSVDIFIQDTSKTDGSGLTGLVFNSAGLTAYYNVPASASTSITLATQTATGAYSSGGFVAVDATNQPGKYRLDIPNAALASGRSVSIFLKGASNMAQTLFEIDLNAQVNVTSINAVATTSVTTVNANVGTTQPTNFTGTAGSALVKSDMVDIAGAAVSTTTAQIGANAVQVNGQTTSAAGTVTFPGTIASPTNITAGTITTVTNLTNAPTAGDFTATMKTSITTAATAATPTAAAVTGAVGSVTAAVATTSNVKKNTASAGFMFPMTDATTHTLKTGLTVAGTVSIDGASYVSLTNAVSEIGTTGTYTINLAAADVNGNHIMLLFKATAADDRPIEIITQP